MSKNVTVKKSPQVLSGIYKHYKGKYYVVIGVASHSETLEKFVIYAHLYPAEGTAFWIRPQEMFFETVTYEGKTLPRFEYIGSELPPGTY
jgi:hypothetical protein